MRGYAESFTALSKDDTYYCAIALYALSNVTLGDHIRNCSKWCRRILDIAVDNLELRRAQKSVELVSESLYSDESSVESLIDRYYPNGLLYGVALHCIFSIETEYPIQDESLVNFERFLGNFYPSVVQSVAVDCIIRLEVLKLIGNISEESITKIFNIVISKITDDSTKPCVKRTVVSLLYDILLDRPSQIIPSALSLDEVTLQFVDCIVTQPHRRYQQQIRSIFKTFSSKAYADCLLTLHEIMTSSGRVDQGSRTLLLSVWNYIFGDSIPTAIQEYCPGLVLHSNQYDCGERQLKVYDKREMLPSLRLVPADISTRVTRTEEMMRFNDCADTM